MAKKLIALSGGSNSENDTTTATPVLGFRPLAVVVVGPQLRSLAELCYYASGADDPEAMSALFSDVWRSLSGLAHLIEETERNTCELNKGGAA